MSTSLVFEAVLHSVETGDEKNLATFYIMNTSPNRLGWGVTDKALEEALPTLLKKTTTIGCGPGYKIDDHYPDPIPVGKWVSFNKPNGYALATAEITDEVVLENLKRGDWGPISVVIDAYRVKEKNGNKTIESFEFKNVDFVDVPAFPQAGFMNFAGLAGETVVNPIELCASFYESQSIGQAPGSLLNPEEKRKMQKQITEVKKELETLTASVAKIETLETTITELKEGFDEFKAELKPGDDKDEDDDKDKDDDKENPEFVELKAKMKAYEDERHAERLAATIEAKTKAGLVKDLKKETELLAGLNDETLTILRLEYEAITEKMAKTPPTGPKAQYSASDSTELDDAMAEMRETLRLPVRESGE
ncbi:MAG: phage scaffolding protein [Candidatus Bathyarchaeota archaeon]|nr:phage scaffolding protein [Candidatus Bathyarchaeota archaeon]